LFFFFLWGGGGPGGQTNRPTHGGGGRCRPLGFPGGGQGAWGWAVKPLSAGLLGHIGQPGGAGASRGLFCFSCNPGAGFGGAGGGRRAAFLIFLSMGGPEVLGPSGEGRGGRVTPSGGGGGKVLARGGGGGPGGGGGVAGGGKTPGPPLSGGLGCTRFKRGESGAGRGGGGTLEPGGLCGRGFLGAGGGRVRGGGVGGADFVGFLSLGPQNGGALHRFLFKGVLSANPGGRAEGWPPTGGGGAFGCSRPFGAISFNPPRPGGGAQLVRKILGGPLCWLLPGGPIRPLG